MDESLGLPHAQAAHVDAGDAGPVGERVRVRAVDRVCSRSSADHEDDEDGHENGGPTPLLHPVHVPLSRRIRR